MTSSSASRSYKIVEPSGLVDNLENDGSTESKSTSDQSNTTRVSWKTSKILSRTLSSIEVIRAMKSNKSNNNSHNQHSAISPTRPSVIVTATGDSSISTTLAPVIKTSSRREVIIKDDPSSSSSVSHDPTSPEARVRSGKAASEWKILKNKLSFLRKRSTGSTSGPDEVSTSSISPGPGDEGEGSSRRLSSNSRTGSARTSRSGSQDEGIVCKREDLINLLVEATKVASSGNSPVNLTSSNSPTSATTPTPLTTTSSPSSSITSTTTIKPSIIKSDPPSGSVSPTSVGIRKVILKTTSVSSAPVQSTDQQSTKLVKKSALKKNPSADCNNNNLNNSNFRSSSADGSVSTNDSIGFVETKIIVPSKPSLKFDHSHENRPERRSGKGIQFKDNYDNSSTRTQSDQNQSVRSSSPSPILSTTIPTTTTTTITTDCDVDAEAQVVNESTDNQDNSESPSSSSVAAVKWDESNVVDAMMLGDAIQAFLKGMEASVQKPTEKRVFFKK